MKRKPFQSTKSAAASCPVVHHEPERVCELNSVEYTQNDTTLSEPDAVMAQMNGRKRFEDLQSVPLSSIYYPSTSCSVMSPAALTNGTDPAFLAPPSSKPPHVVPKDRWTLPGSSRDQTWAEAWLCGKVHSGPDSWGSEPGAEGVPESSWTRDRDRGQDQGWSMGPGPGPGPGRETEWRKEPWSNREPTCRTGLNPAAVRASAPQLSIDQTPSAPPVKKEPPVYPPGSEEERWQLQIVAKGRVTCPKCKSVSRKTVDGLKKHMDNCRLEPFSCPHCGKQLKSSTGMKYHIMADHSLLPSSDAKDQDDRAVKEKLRKILKRLGKLKCSREGCSAAFTSIMGYFYHTRKCGKEQSELEKMVLNCSHCGKTYKSKAGLEYHLKSEHAPAAVKTEEEEEEEPQTEESPERTASGRVQRASAQVANFHLAEIAHNELPKDWPKRKFQSDLVPDDKKLKYSRPGLPAFSQELLRKWKNEVKLQRKVQCPNEGCGSTYTSVSGLKAHLGLCTKGDFEAGKYRCLICNKEFNSESGVKYHINSVHSQDWFVTNKKASKKFEKLLKNQPKEFHHHVTEKHFNDEYFQHQHFQHFHSQPSLHHLQPQNLFLCPEHQPLPPQTDPQTPVHYTPLQPVWVDKHPDEEDVKETDLERDQRNCFVFLGEDPGSSGGVSDVELERQRQIWDMKRPGLMVDAVKRQ